MAKISVLMPVYNVENYLDETLKSLSEQRFHDFEVLMVDDGSTDNTSSICAAWCRNDSRFQVIHQDNSGSGSARNTAIDWAMQSDSEYISWVDADDIVSINFLQKLYEIAIKEGCDIVQCGFISFGDEAGYNSEINLDIDDDIKYFNGMDFEFRLLNGSTDASVLWNKLYRKKLFEHIRVPICKNFSGRKHDDESLVWKLYLAADRIAETSARLYAYRIHNGSIEHSHLSRESLETFYIWNARWLFYKKNHLSELSVLASEKILLIFSLLLSNNKNQYKQYKEFNNSAKEIYKYMKSSVREARRPDLRVLYFAGTITMKSFRLYGLIYKKIKEIKSKGNLIKLCFR